MLKTNNQSNSSPTLCTLGSTTFFNEESALLDLLKGTVHAHTTEKNNHPARLEPMTT